MFAAPAFDNPWRFEANPEVYVLVAFLVGAYIYSVRVLGPRAVTHGPVLKRSNLVAFVTSMVLLFVASTWPIHQIGERYLYSVHMLQHMMLSYFLPPLLLLATPEWLLRILVGSGRGYRVIRFMCRPVVAALVFNVVVMVTHIPGVVNASTQNGPLHYGLHLSLVLTAMLMWMPLVGPFKEFHMSWGGKCIYLFLQSVVPTVPAGWLTFAEGAVYKHYNIPVRVWGMTVTDDQQLAGAIMKIGGSIFLWTIVVFWFFKRFAPNWAEENTYRRDRKIPTAEIVGHDEHPLTFDQVTAAFEQTPAPAEH